MTSGKASDCVTFETFFQTERKIDILEKRLVIVRRIILRRRYDDWLATPVARRGHEPGARRRRSLNGTHVASAQYRYFEIIAGRIAAHRVRPRPPRSRDGNEGSDVEQFSRVGDDLVEEVERLQAAETVSDESDLSIAVHFIRVFDEETKLGEILGSVHWGED